MPLGMIILFVLAALIYFGLAHRVLDRMRLTDGQALMFLAFMFVGGFIDVPISRGQPAVSINIGGAIVPLALAIYLLVRAGTPGERTRALLAAGATAATIWLIGTITDFDPARGRMMLLDPLWLYGIVGGIMGYISGRSRRGSFVAGVLGIIAIDVIHTANIWINGIRSDAAIGGAGVFDSVVLAGVIAVGFAEIFGEVRERLQGGPRTDGDRPAALKRDEGVEEGDPHA